ncbi:MAG: 50S ribosomal protein L6 [Candidatus Azambacteria bacterium GW2011_GWD2_46_48]|uniref:Large ribosomal subunit protein uL6 n=2 Tax=Candidatus Azamiibacteriota TaxID=1752741 RepID=A0A0G1QBW1_9BACT|nr:MAG: 50S ribosomal protein L6 [Candidatus Azambacteria bacterium GW2011_GWD2_46_48]
MSKIGKKPIQIPTGVTIKIEDNKITVSGPQGSLERTFRPELEGDVVKVLPVKETKQTPALWGLTRALIANMVDGVVKKFEKKLEISGIGYQASVQGGDLVLKIGFTHPVAIVIPDGVEVKVEKNIVVITGRDKEAVGQFAASVRARKKPEPYKGKGIYYAGEKIRRKAGKKLASAS